MEEDSREAMYPCLSSVLLTIIRKKGKVTVVKLGEETKLVACKKESTFVERICGFTPYYQG
jgi:hypothetical protein